MPVFRLAALGAVLLLGCGPAVPAKFSEVKQQVFTASCTFSSCHNKIAGGAGGLQLDSAVAYQQLVGVPAAGVTGRLRVVAGDLDASYLIEKLTRPTPSAGGRMPLGAEGLDAARLQLVRDWVSAGAKDD